MFLSIHIEFCPRFERSYDGADAAGKLEETFAREDESLGLRSADRCAGSPILMSRVFQVCMCTDDMSWLSITSVDVC
jgi:hypothetical protein